MVELQRAQIPFTRELKYEVAYKGVILPHHYLADFVVWNKIIFEAKAVERLTDAHVKQVLNYLAISKLELGFCQLRKRFVGMETGHPKPETKTGRTRRRFPPLKIRANWRNSRKTFFHGNSQSIRTAIRRR